MLHKLLIITFGALLMPHTYTDSTENYYNQNCSSYIQRTMTISMEEAYETFLKRLPAHSHILDGGCGPGRDTKYFLDAGYTVTAFDAAEEFVKFSTTYTGQKTLHLTFQEIEYENVFDGIWTSASLLHVPSKELPTIMTKLKNALKNQGVWFISFKYGTFEGYENGRYFTHQTETSFRNLIEKIDGLQILDLWQEHSHSQADQIWLQAILTKTDTPILD